MEEASWIMTQFRQIFAAMNYCVYSLVEWIFYGIFDIATLQTNEGLIGDIYMRIYTFLGIFMVFKLTVSFFKYLVSPDTMADKEKGAGKLVGRTITMLILLILLPNLFPLLGRVQTEFLPVLPKVILGQSTDNSSTVGDNAKLMAGSVLSAFYRPAIEGVDDITSFDDPLKKMMSSCDDKTSGYYDYSFNFIFSLIAGCVVAVILISITLKIATRVFKMIILEMIAPVPVMSYVDPKASKDGAFAAWTKQLTTTFLDLFFRLGVIYVVLMILSVIADEGLPGLFESSTLPNTITRTAYLRVFLMIALLMFAKDAPNFVKDAFGIKHDKDTSGFLAGLTGLTTGAATGAVSGAISGRGLRGAITGAATGGAAGFEGGMTGKKARVWSAAGDAALQARTGDSKAKSGILAAIQSGASKAQLRSSARKLNLTDETISLAKQNMIDAQADAALAERNWQLGLHGYGFRDLDGNLLTDDIDPVTGAVITSAMEKADMIVSQTSSASTIATKNFEKGNKAGDAYRINGSFAEDFAKDRKEAKKAGAPRAVYMAKGRYNPHKR